MFKIRFRGLITLATINQRDVAVLFQARNHTPTLMVNNDDVIGMPTLTVIGQTLQTTCYALYGHVEISDLVPGPAVKTITGVPSLRTIVTNYGAVRRDIVERRNHPDFHAYVELEQGQMFVEDWFELQATFDRSSSNCIARTTVYVTNATGDPVIRASGSLNAGEIQLRQHATVTIANIEIGINPPPPAEHYAAFLNFFETADEILYPIPTTDCGYGSGSEELGCIGQSNLGVECSNTQFP